MLSKIINLTPKPLKKALIKKLILSLGLNLDLANINDDGTVDYLGAVDLTSKNLKEIPFQFGFTLGSFNCSNNQLTSLKNAPKVVQGVFYCSKNLLENLKYAPVSVKGGFYCSTNKLSSLEGCPKEILDSFDCSFNKLTNLKYCPDTVLGYFAAKENQIDTLEYFPKKVGGFVTIVRNHVQDISTLKRCEVGETFYIGGIANDTNTVIRTVNEERISPEDLQLKFKEDDCIALDRELSDSLGKTKRNNTKI